MVTVIANQKRTTKIVGADVPCAFDPLDGNAIKWIEDQPCVERWLSFRVGHDGSEQSHSDLTVTFRDGSEITLSAPNSGASTYDGTIPNRITYGRGLSDFDSKRFTYAIPPVWSRDVASMSFSFEVTSGWGTSTVHINWHCVVGFLKTGSSSSFLLFDSGAYAVNAPTGGAWKLVSADLEIAATGKVTAGVVTE